MNLQEWNEYKKSLIDEMLSQESFPLGDKTYLNRIIQYEETRENRLNRYRIHGNNLSFEEYLQKVRSTLPSPFAHKGRRFHFYYSDPKTKLVFQQFSDFQHIKVQHYFESVCVKGEGCSFWAWTYKGIPYF